LAFFMPAYARIPAPISVYSYYTQFFIFIIIGLLCSIYGIVCGAKKTALGELYLIFAIIAVIFAGAVLFLSAYNTYSCYSVFDAYDSVILNSNNIKAIEREYFNICSSFKITLSGSLAFVIGTLLAFIGKRHTG